MHHGFAAWDLPEWKAHSAGLAGFTALSIEKKSARLPHAAPSDRNSPLAFNFAQDVQAAVNEPLDSLITLQSQKRQQRNPWASAFDRFPGGLGPFLRF